MLAVPSSIDPSIFRAYDIRGIVGESLTEESIFLIGQALGSLVREQGEHEIALARDGRLSGPALEKALCNGILAAGCDVIELGMAATPLLYYAAHQLSGCSGVMLTGSHNPPNYNGLKMLIKGASLAETDISRLRDRILNQQLLRGAGKRRECSVDDQYIADIERSVHLKRPLHIVVDAGNGVAGRIAPALYRRLGCEVDELFCEVDGRFPHHHPDPSQPENLQSLVHAVREKNADLGLAFDGDGDRLGVVAQNGEIIFADRVLMLFAKKLLLENPHAKIIYDVKCSDQLAALIRSLNGEPLMWKTGHSLIKMKMAEVKALLAGEMSGHFFFKDKWYGFDDALYAGARLLEILSQQEQTSSEIFAAIPNSVNTPELKIAVPEHKKFQLMEDLIRKAAFTEAQEVMTIDGLRVSFSEGWGLIRPSNTTPCLILRFEAINELILKEIQNLFREWILSVNAELILPF